MSFKFVASPLVSPAVSPVSVVSADFSEELPELEEHPVRTLMDNTVVTARASAKNFLNFIFIPPFLMNPYFVFQPKNEKENRLNYLSLLPICVHYTTILQQVIIKCNKLS